MFLRCESGEPRMSLVGHSRQFGDVLPMSALRVTSDQAPLTARLRPAVARWLMRPVAQRAAAPAAPAGPQAGATGDAVSISSLRFAATCMTGDAPRTRILAAATARQSRAA